MSFAKKSFAKEVLHGYDDSQTKSAEKVCKLTVGNFAKFVDVHTCVIINTLGVIGQCLTGKMPLRYSDIKGIMMEFPDMDNSHCPAFPTLDEFSSPEEVNALKMMILPHTPPATRRKLTYAEAAGAHVAKMDVVDLLKPIEGRRLTGDAMKLAMASVVESNKEKKALMDEFEEKSAKLMAYVRRHASDSVAYVMDTCPVYRDLIIRNDILAALFYLKRRFSWRAGEQISAIKEKKKAWEEVVLNPSMLNEVESFHRKFNEHLREVKLAGGEVSGEEALLVYFKALKNVEEIAPDVRRLEEHAYGSLMEAQSAFILFVNKNRQWLGKLGKKRPPYENAPNERNFKVQRKDDKCAFAAMNKHENNVARSVSRNGSCNLLGSPKECSFTSGGATATPFLNSSSLLSRLSLCRYYQKGECRLLKCPFLHVKAADVPADFDLKGVCKFVALTGECPHGPNCRFLSYHDASAEKFRNYNRTRVSAHQNKAAFFGVLNNLSVLNCVPCFRDEGVVVYDTGANISIIRDECLLSFVSCERSVVQISGVGGPVGSECYGASMVPPFNLQDVMFCKSAPSNILSDKDARMIGPVIRIDDDEGDRFVIKGIEGDIVFWRNDEDLFVWKLPMEKRVALLTAKDVLLQGGNKATVEKMIYLDRLHRALSYCGKEVLLRYVDSNLLKEKMISKRDVEFYFNINHKGSCVGCIRGKGRSMPEVTVAKPSVYKCGELVHLDIVYITTEKSNLPPLMTLISIDDFSGFCVYTPIIGKAFDDVMKGLRLMIAEYAKHGHVVVAIRSDCESTIYHNSVRIQRDLGVKLFHSDPGRHERIAERAVLSITELFRATIFGLPYPLPLLWYPDLLKYTVDSVNLCYHDRNIYRTPWQVFKDKTVDVSHIVNTVFGAVVAMKVRGEATDSARKDFAVVLGRDHANPGAALVYNFDSKKLLSCRDVEEVEITPSILRNIEILDYSKIRRGINYYRIVGSKKLVGETGEGYEVVQVSECTKLGETSPKNKVGMGDNVLGTHPNNIKNSSRNDYDGIADDIAPNTTKGPDVCSPGMSCNALKVDMDKVDSQGPVEQDSTSTSPRRMSDDGWPPASDGNSNVVVNGKSDNVGIDERMDDDGNVRRSTRLRGKNRPNWSAIVNFSVAESIRDFGKELTDKAILAEVRQLEEKGVWEYMTPDEVLTSDNVLPSTIVMKDKKDSEGKFIKMKGRLAVCGNYESMSENDLVASPTASFSSLMTVLAISAKRRMRKMNADITGAYLNAELKHRVVMKLGKDVSSVLCRNNSDLRKFLNAKGCICVLLKKCLYGLRVSAKAWYELFSGTIVKAGYVASIFDPCVFLKIVGNIRSYVVIYVDDLLSCSDDESEVDRIEKLLRDVFKEFTMNKDDTLIEFLGMRITTDIVGNIRVSQSGYIRRIIEDFQVTSVKKYPLPIIARDFDRDESPLCDDPKQYRALVMRLMYAAVRTRPDIYFAVVFLSCSVQEPREVDMERVLHLLQYLNGCPDLCVSLLSSGEFNLVCYVDASFMSSTRSRSHTGFVIYLDDVGSGAVLCKSMVQKSIAESSMEAELIALNEAKTVFLWFIGLTEELIDGVVKGKTIFEDNSAAITTVLDANAKFKGRSKFIDRKYFSISEVLKDGLLNIKFIGTDEMIADFLTKSLMGEKFERFRIDLLGNDECLPQESSLRGVLP